MKQRVVVTGLGIVSPIGIGVEPFWKAALEGRSGISAIDAFGDLPLEDYRCRVAGRIQDFYPAQLLDTPHAERVDRYAQFTLAAAQEAVVDSALRMDRESPHRVGVIVGAGMGGMVMGEKEIEKLYRSRKPHRVHPNFIPVITLNSASGILAIVLGAKGLNLTISTACSSSAHAIGLALGAIRSGQADTVITVGADASITPLVFAGFCSLRVLSSHFNDQPERASRPFDQERDGFVMGEGAAALVLESLPHARKRKARIYAEVSGYAATSEAHHMVIPREDGTDVATTIALALRDADVRPGDVDYINAHATSTPIGDAVEVKAIHRVLRARAKRVLVNATKSMVGHTLGAAGAIGSVVCALALDTGLVHPTANYEHPDPACRLPGLSTRTQQGRLNVALLNAFGFGSNNAAVVFKKYRQT